MKTITGDIIILLVCNKNHNHMMYKSWDTEWGGQNFLSFYAIYCLFTHPDNAENHLEILLF